MTVTYKTDDHTDKFNQQFLNPTTENRPQKSEGSGLCFNPNVTNMIVTPIYITVPRVMFDYNGKHIDSSDQHIGR